MKKLMALVLGASLSVSLGGLLGGCAANLAESGPEHQRRIARNMDLDSRQFIDDLDYVLLDDEPSHLTANYMPHKVH